MKVVCVKKYFKEAISLSEKITGKNLSLPILNNILISSDDGKLKINATNLEIGINIEIPAKIEKKGKIAVPAGIVNNFINNLTNEDNITIESQNSNLLISTINSSTIIKGQNTDDFPDFPQRNNLNKKISIPCNDFILGLRSVYYSCSNSNIKPEFSSVYISIDKNEAVFVATDSFRLAEKKFNYQNIKGVASFLIPIKTVVEILRIFDGREGDIDIYLDKNQIFINHENINFVSRLTDGVFPDYNQIIHKSFITDVVVNKNVFLGSLKTSSIFSNKLNEAHFNFDIKTNLMIIKTSNQETGEHIMKVPVKITGEKIELSFNYKYIIDCLGYISSSDVVLRFSNTDKRLLINGANDYTFQYLVMPMRDL